MNEHRNAYLANILMGNARPLWTEPSRTQRPANKGNVRRDVSGAILTAILLALPFALRFMTQA